MFDELELLALETESVETEDALCDFDLDGDVEYVSKAEAVADIIDSQDPDLTYVSKDGVKWEAKSNSEDSTKSDWTNVNGYQYLNEYSILEALEQMLKTDKSLIAKITANLL